MFQSIQEHWPGYVVGVLVVILIVLVAYIELIHDTATISVFTCERLSEEIIEMSQDRASGAIPILKIYDIEEIESPSDPDYSIECSGLAALENGEDRSMTFYVETDEDGDSFQGYSCVGCFRR